MHTCTCTHTSVEIYIIPSSQASSTFDISHKTITKCVLEIKMPTKLLQMNNAPTNDVGGDIAPPTLALAKTYVKMFGVMQPSKLDVI